MIVKRRQLTNKLAGTERLASAIGNGGLADIGNVEPYPLRINRNRLDTLYSLTRPDTTAELTYFFHPDHLGSASWITDMSGQPVQHLQYMPFGGDYLDQQDPNTDYSERFRFTGKERDAETGYDYFGARYYSSSLGIWLSVDPMSDKYPSLSPYVYCADNPMRLVDPKGEEIDLSRLKEKQQNRLVNSLSFITGLTLSIDANGFLRYAEPTGDEKGSASARADLIFAINLKDEEGNPAIIVMIYYKSEGVQLETGEKVIRLSNSLDENEDNSTNGLGMVFMHELGHAAFGDEDPKNKTTEASYVKMGDFGWVPKRGAELGEAVTRVNNYRKELNMPLRIAYPRNPKNKMVPFSNNNGKDIEWKNMY